MLSCASLIGKMSVPGLRPQVVRSLTGMVIVSLVFSQCHGQSVSFLLLHAQAYYLDKLLMMSSKLKAMFGMRLRSKDVFVTFFTTSLLAQHDYYYHEL